MTEPEAAVAIVRAARPEESILLIRRTEREGDPWSGHWSFPGGRRAPKDPDLLHTALRELEEECGIRLSQEHLETDLPAMEARRRVGRFVLVAPFVFHLDGELPAVLDPREAVEALWTPVRGLLDPTRHSLRPVPARPPEMLFPAIDLNGLPLWGFTYRLITGWLGLCPKDGPIEQAGFEAARLLLDFLLSHGLTLNHGWVDRTVEEGRAGQQLVRVAEVRGVIPVALVLARFSVAGSHVFRVNVLEVRPNYIRVAGLAFEDYFIYASGSPASHIMS